MTTKRSRVVFHTFLFIAFCFSTGVVSAQDLPDISALLAKVRDHQDALDRMRENYAYTQTATTDQMDKHGKQNKQESKKYEVTFYRHRAIQRLTEIDGKPLPGDQAERENKRVEKLIRELEAGEHPADPEENRHMKIGTLLRAAKFSKPRREQYRNRNAIVFDFSPDPAFKPANSDETFYTAMAGTMWVNEADLQVSRIEFNLQKDFKVGGGVFFDMKKGAHFVNEQDRFFDEIWLPASRQVTFEARAILFYSFGIRETDQFTDYRKFNVTTEESAKPPAH